MLPEQAVDCIGNPIHIHWSFNSVLIWAGWASRCSRWRTNSYRKKSKSWHFAVHTLKEQYTEVLETSWFVVDLSISIWLPSSFKIFFLGWGIWTWQHTRITMQTKLSQTQRISCDFVLYCWRVNALNRSAHVIIPWQDTFLRRAHEPSRGSISMQKTAWPTLSRPRRYSAENLRFLLRWDFLAHQHRHAHKEQ